MQYAVWLWLRSTRRGSRNHGTPEFWFFATGLEVYDQECVRKCDPPFVRPALLGYQVCNFLPYRFRRCHRLTLQTKKGKKYNRIQLWPTKCQWLQDTRLLQHSMGATMKESRVHLHWNLRWGSIRRTGPDIPNIGSYRKSFGVKFHPLIKILIKQNIYWEIASSQMRHFSGAFFTQTDLHIIPGPVSQ